MSFVKVVYTKHALEKFKELEKEGWKITKSQIRQTIKNPKWTGVSSHGQETAMILINTNHILRVILNKTGGIIKVITFHIGKRGRYESTL